MGGSGTAQPSTVFCHIVPAQTGSGPALPSSSWCSSSRCSLGSRLQGEPRGPDLDAPSPQELGGGAGWPVCTAPGGGSCVGLVVGKGRSRRAAPLEWRDVPPAGLSGRSRSCPNRPPGSHHRLQSFWAGRALRGVGAPLPFCAVPAVSGITLMPRHGTPWGDAAPKCIPIPLHYCKVGRGLGRH